MHRLFAKTYHTGIIDTPFGHKYYVNADFTATGSPYKPIEKFISNNVLQYYANTHSNAHNGKLMSHYIEQSKSIIRSCTNAHEDDKIIFTGNGCTGAIIHLIHALNLKQELTPKAVVFLSVSEHHSNYLPWTHLPVDLEIISVQQNGQINLTELTKKMQMYSDRPLKICSFIAGSNVTGVLQPTIELARVAHQHGFLIMFDYAAIAPYIPINIHTDSASYYDAVYISPHKFLGGPGSSGVLIANSKLFFNQVPFCPGGGTVRFVCKKF